MSRRKIVVTGASGFTGLHACSHLERLGYEVVAVLRRPGAMDSILASTADGGDVIREHVIDLNDRTAVIELLDRERPDALLHMAGLNAVGGSWEQPVAYMQLNVMATLYLLDGLRLLGLTRCRTLIAGSMLGCRLRDDEPPRPAHPYGLSKTLQTLTASAWGHLFGLPVCIAQPSNLIGPGASNGICGLIGAHVAKREQEGEAPPFRLTSLEEPRDYIDVRDTVRAYGLILERGEPGGVYPIGSGKVRTLGGIAREFERQARVKMEWRIGTTADLIGEQLPVRLSGLADPEDERLGAGASAVDLGPMRSLDWAPELAFDQSVADILDYHRQAGQIKGKEGG
ncbi:NAD-dependent epimerase/dehydratase family protein [Paenibacillus filicis]|uniref:NAD-dependent epimerase/dehydratase family protein n=1 Tax=Paenibacillus filicis TaxID=669464 RepID=A0ABU9DT57_9BACL